MKTRVATLGLCAALAVLAMANAGGNKDAA